GGGRFSRMRGRKGAEWKSPGGFEADGRNMVSDRYNYRYSDEKLEKLSEQIQAIRASADTVFVVFHNDPNAHSLYNGFKLRRLLEPAKRMEIPERLGQVFPEHGEKRREPLLIFERRHDIVQDVAE